MRHALGHSIKLRLLLVFLLLALAMAVTFISAPSPWAGAKRPGHC
jgi:hypothetical protein